MDIGKGEGRVVERIMWVDGKVRMKGDNGVK